MAKKMLVFTFAFVTCFSSMFGMESWSAGQNVKPDQQQINRLRINEKNREAQQQLNCLRGEIKIDPNWFALYVKNHSNEQVRSFIEYVQNHTAQEIEKTIKEIELIENMKPVNSTSLICTSENYQVIRKIEEDISKFTLLFNVNIENFLIPLTEQTRLLYVFFNLEELPEKKSKFLTLTLLKDIYLQNEKLNEAEQV